MGDDFREEYTDLKKHGIPFCAQECTFFGFFRLTLSLSKAYVAGSSIWARRTRNQHEIYVASCCTSWIQVHCCGTKMNCIGKKQHKQHLAKSWDLLGCCEAGRAGTEVFEAGPAVGDQNGWMKFVGNLSGNWNGLKPPPTFCVSTKREAPCPPATSSYHVSKAGELRGILLLLIHQGVSYRVLPALQWESHLTQTGKRSPCHRDSQMGVFFEVPCWTNITTMLII